MRNRDLGKDIDIALIGETHDSYGTMCLPDQEKKEGCF
jgi:hypothetical protein